MLMCGYDVYIYWHEVYGIYMLAWYVYMSKIIPGIM